MTLDEIRDQIFSALEMSRAGLKAVDPVARAFSEGRVSGLDDALRIIDKALQVVRAERTKAIASGKDPGGLRDLKEDPTSKPGGSPPRR